MRRSRLASGGKSPASVRVWLRANSSSLVGPLNAVGLEEVGGQVALTSIAKYHHDDFTATEPLSDLQRGATIGPRGNSNEQTFFARDAPRVGGRVLVAD